MATRDFWPPDSWLYIGANLDSKDEGHGHQGLLATRQLVIYCIGANLDSKDEGHGNQGLLATRQLVHLSHLIVLPCTQTLLYWLFDIRKKKEETLPTLLNLESEKQLCGSALVFVWIRTRLLRSILIRIQTLRKTRPTNKVKFQ